MRELKVKMKNIRNIKELEIGIPLKPNIYGIIGKNGSGKSSIMACMANLIYSRSLDVFKREDIKDDSYVFISDSKNELKWKCNSGGWYHVTGSRSIRYHGLYEGSLFYGTRFEDSKKVDDLIERGILNDKNIVDADEYVKEKLSFILHGDFDHYTNLKRIKNKRIAEKNDLKNVPYFIEVQGRFVSQYRMSSGECLLISLLHFIYNSIVRKSIPQDDPILVLIDEIELALHPLAVTRFFVMFKELIDIHNLVVILSSHSTELIRMISPYNLYYISNNEGEINIINPCYPSYAIRDVYKHDGYDYVILVEDNLAKMIVETIIREEELMCSKLVHVLPAGGWVNVLDLQEDIYNFSLFGTKTNVFSVLDGDIESEAKKYDKKAMKKLFIPIGCVEKFLLKVLINEPIVELKKIINDLYFSVESIDAIISDYRDELKKMNKRDVNGKILYSKIRDNMEKRNIKEEEFIKSLCDNARKYIKFSKFENNMKKMLSE